MRPWRVLVTVLALCSVTAILPGWHPVPASHSQAMFVYMCGGDLETNAGHASADLTELASAVPAGTTVVVQTGGAKAWRGHGVDASKLQRWLVADGGLELIEALPLANMATARTFADFLQFAVTEYRADQMSLVLWGHGNGVSVCSDQLYYYDTLTAQEIGSALGTLPRDVHFETVILDACHAATVDLALAVAGRASYLVASPHVLPASGVDYSAIDFSSTGPDFAVSVADSVSGSSPQMSVVRLDQVPRLQGLLEDVELTALPGLERFAVYRAGAYFLVDIGDALPLLPDDVSDAARDLLVDTVVHRADAGDQAAGLSLVVPRHRPG